MKSKHRPQTFLEDQEQGIATEDITNLNRSRTEADGGFVAQAFGYGAPASGGDAATRVGL
jgi:hypothetical protein